jgi:hypothetical protein
VIGVAEPGVWFRVELMDLMSFAPGPVLFVFQMGNLLDDPPAGFTSLLLARLARLIAQSGFPSTISVVVPGMKWVFRSSM